jgi:transposase
MPVNWIAKLMKVHDTKIWRLLEKYVVGTRAEKDFSAVTKIGIDETSMRKNHDYVTLFVDLQENQSHTTVY